MKKRLLIIEDDALLLGIYAEKFASEGFDVILTSDGVSGLEHLKVDRPDAVLLDLALPKLTGLEILESLHDDGDEELKKTPVIVVTNIGHEADIKRAISLGAKGYLIKSDTPLPEVIATVRDLFGKKTAKKKTARG